MTYATLRIASHILAQGEIIDATPYAATISEGGRITSGLRVNPVLRGDSFAERVRKAELILRRART